MDFVAQVRAQFHRLPDSMHAIRVDGNAGWCRCSECNPQSTRIGAHFLKEWPRGRWRKVWIANVGARSGIEECGAVANGTSDNVLDRQSAESVAEVRPEGIAGARRL